MAARNTDVNLIVRARTEGEKAIAALGDTLEHVFTGAREGGVDLASLARNLGTLDKAAGMVAGSVDKAAAALDRQKSSITENKAALAALVAQQSEARQVLAGFGDQADKAFVGPRTEGFTKTYSAVRAEADRLEVAVSRLTTTIGTQESQLQGTQSSLLRLSSISRAVGEGQAEAAAQIELTNEALRRQADDSRRAAAAQSFYNAKGGPQHGSAADNGATYDALIANLQRLEGEATRASRALDPVGNAIRDAERAIRDVHDAASHGIIGSDEAIVRERQLRDELAQTVNTIASGAARVRQIRKDSVTEYQALINSVTGVTGPKATDSGATYDALAQREAETQRLQQQQRARDAETLRAAAERNSGVSAAPATSAGAGFSALEAEAQATAARAAGNAYAAFENAVRKGAEAMREADAASERDAADLRQLREAMDPLAAIQDRLNASLARYRELAAAGKLSTEELAAAEKKVTAEADRARRAAGNFNFDLFGLRPHEVQNLSYQINDVVTGLSSGQHVGQVFAQQGGQILQLWPRITSAIIGALSNPYILAAVGTFAALATVISHAASEAEHLRDITSGLTLSADGSLYDPEKLEASAKMMRGYGASMDDAVKSVKLFASADLNQDRFDEFGRAAINMADVMQVKVPEAAKKLADAFSGGYDAIAKLNAETHSYSSEQLKSIKQAFDDGDAQRGRAMAFDILIEKLAAAARQMNGPSVDATRSLSKAWDDLLTHFSKMPATQGILSFFGEIGKAISEATGNAAAFTTVAERAARIAKLKADIPDLQRKYDLTKQSSNSLFSRSGDLSEINAEIDARKGELKQLLDQQASEAKAKSGKDADTRNKTSEAQKNADAQVLLATDRMVSQKERLLAAERGITNEDEKQRRIHVAEESARQQIGSANPGASDAAKQAYVKAAGDVERATIAREDEQRAKTAAAERKKAIEDAEKAIVGAEGTGKNRAGSGAAGFGQFIPSTYLSYFAKAYGDTGQSRDQILATRDDPAIAKGVLDAFTKANAAVLESFGAKVSSGNLYLAHFLGTGTTGGPTRAILQAQNDTPIDKVLSKFGNFAQIVSQNAAYLRTEGGKGRFRTVGEFKTFISNKVGDTGSPQAEGQAKLAELTKDSDDKQKALNQSIRHGNEDRADAIKALQEENGLYGTALLAVQRAKAIQDAEREKRQQVEDANKNLSKGEAPVEADPAEIAKARALAGAYFDVQHAREATNAKLADVQRPVEGLQQQIDLLRQQSEFLRSIGESKDADAVDKEITVLGGSIQSAYDKLIEFYRALDTAGATKIGITGSWEEQRREIDNTIEKYEQAKQATQEWGKVAGISSKEIAQALSSNIASGFTNFINRVASGKNVFRSLSEGVREFAATFISSIAQMIVQLLAYAAAVSILRALGVPIPGGSAISNPSVDLSNVTIKDAGGLTSVGTNHAGGMVGSAGGMKRSVSPSIFAAAMRFHTGGIVGIGADEVPIIAKRNEEVLTEGDPRHRANGGLNGGAAPAGPQPIKVVNVFDPDMAAQQILQTRSGERAILNFVHNNSRAFKNALG